MAKLSSQAKGAAQAEKLEAWIRDTPLDEIPRNQFRGVARRRVCLSLNISPSTVLTNQRLSELFQQLDASIARAGARVDEPPRYGAASFATKTLLARCEQLEDEVGVLTEKLKQLEHMEANGWGLP